MVDYIIKKANKLSADEKYFSGLTDIPENWPVECYLYYDIIPDGFELISRDDLDNLKNSLQSEYNTWRNNKNAAAIKDVVKNTVLIPAETFANILTADFTSENISMGITQDNMTTTVRIVLSDVYNCLKTASLYDAIKALKAIPEESKDLKYITNPRLLVFMNKIEAYLKLPLTLSL